MCSTSSSSLQAPLLWLWGLTFTFPLHQWNMGASACRQTTAAPQQAFQWPQLPTEPHITAGTARLQPCQALKEPSHSLPHDKAWRCDCWARVCVCVLGHGWVSFTHWLLGQEGWGVSVTTSLWLTALQMMCGTRLKRFCVLEMCSWNKGIFDTFGFK